MSISKQENIVETFDLVLWLHVQIPFPQKLKTSQNIFKKENFIIVDTRTKNDGQCYPLTNTYHFHEFLFYDDN